MWNDFIFPYYRIIIPSNLMFRCSIVPAAQRCHYNLISEYYCYSSHKTELSEKDRCLDQRCLRVIGLDDMAKEQFRTRHCTVVTLLNSMTWQV